MKRLVAVSLFCLVFTLFSAVEVACCEEAGYTDQEITFQGIKWDSSDKQVIDEAYRLKIIKKKEYFNGSGKLPCFVWPQSDLNFRYDTIRWFPEIIKDGNVAESGLWERSLGCSKSVGGHNPSSITFHYTGTIRHHLDSDRYTISNQCDHLIAVSLTYNNQSTGEDVEDVFWDLLNKLTSQYGTFVVVATNSIHKKEIQKKASPIAEVYVYDDEGVKLKDDRKEVVFAVIHGLNDTGIVMKWTKREEINLFYAKDNSYLYVQQLSEALEHNSKTKVVSDDIGL